MGKPTRKAPSSPFILIVDDHSVARDGVRLIIKSKYPDSEFIGCSSGEKALEAIKLTSFDLVFLDIALPGLNGLDTLRKIKSINPNLPFIMLSVFCEEAYSLRSFELGAAAYLNKGVEREEIFRSVEAALSGRKYITPFLADKLSNRLIKKSEVDGVDSLSLKEHSVFLKLASGVALKQIAAELSISPKTVTTYRSRILEKLKVDSNAALTKVALTKGLIE